MSKVDIALIQIAVSDGESPAHRLDRGLALIASIDRPVKLAMLPELWVPGFFNFPDYDPLAEPLDGPSAARFSSLASKQKIWLHAGSIVERSTDGSLYNTSLLFDPAGNLAASYRKAHLFGYQSEEQKILRAGDSVANVSTEIGNLGLTTCYDLRFPELYRCLSSRGVEVNLIAATWPAARLEHWIILVRARAIENLSYVVACNSAGANRGNDLGGNSMIVDPWGEIVARASSEESVLYGQIDLEKVSERRNQFPALRDRRW